MRGVQYRVAKDTIMKFEDTMLARLVSEKWNPKKSEAAIFIDRDGERFKYILDFYRDEQILVPRTVAIETIKNDVMYFGLPEDASIKEAKKEVSLKDARALWNTMKAKKDEVSTNISSMHIVSLALWVVEEFLTKTLSYSYASEERVGDSYP